MNEKKKRKKQFRLNLKESFERRIRTPEPFYNKYEEMRKEPVSTPNNIENTFGEAKRQPQQLPRLSADTQSSSNMQSNVQQEFNLGDAVMISGQEGGVIRYLGNVHFQVIHSNDVLCCQEFHFSLVYGLVLSLSTLWVSMEDWWTMLSTSVANRGMACLLHSGPLS